MARGWILGVGCLGKQREKMGIKWREGKEMGGRCPWSRRGEGDGKVRGMSMAGRGGSWAPFPSPCVPWGPSPSGVPTWLGWGLWLTRTFPLVSAPSSFLQPPTPAPLLVSLSVLFPSLGFPLFSPSLSDLSPAACPSSVAPTNSPPHQAAS